MGRLGRSASRSNEPSRWTPTTRTTPRMPRTTRPDRVIRTPPPGRVDDGQSRSRIARPEDVSDEVDALVTAAVDKGVGVAARTLREAMLSARTVEGAGGRAADAMARALAESILARMMPQAAATRASLEPVGVDTCADVRRTSFLEPPSDGDCRRAVGGGDV